MSVEEFAELIERPRPGAAGPTLSQRACSSKKCGTRTPGPFPDVKL